MAYNEIEALRRNLKIRHGADSLTPAVAATASTEVPIFFDNRTDGIYEGLATVARAFWIPQDTFAGAATGPTININRKTGVGEEPGPGTAPTAAAAAASSTQTSNVAAGTHVYATTFLSAYGETVAGPSSAAVTVTTGQVVNLTAIPTGPTGTTARKIYRSDAGTTTPLYYVGTVADNSTTTFTDLVADITIEAAPAAPTATLNAVAGNVQAGTHVYGYSYVNQYGEGPVSAASAAVTTTTTSGQVAVAGITAGPAGTIARRVYRSTAGNSALLLLGTIADNTTTTYTDNVSDVYLGAAAPTTAYSQVAPTSTVVSTTLATLTFSAGNNAVAFVPEFVPLVTGAVTALSPGDVLTFQIVQNSTGTALTGGRVWVDIDRT